MNKIIYESVIILYLPIALIGYKKYVYDNLHKIKNYNLNRI